MGREKLTKFAQQMGLTRDEARALTDTILATPDKTAYLRGNIEDLTSKIATAELELRTATGEKRIRLKAEIQQAMDDIRYAQNEIDQMHGRTLPIIVSVQRGQARLNGGDAHGGIIGGAATGGIRNDLTWVGENGPELVRLPPGAFVHSNPDSQRMAAGIGGGGPLQLHLTIDTAGRPIEEPLLELIRNSIRVKGGNVQTVLGQN
jgi:hypothetical protein